MQENEHMFGSNKSEENSIQGLESLCGATDTPVLDDECHRAFVTILVNPFLAKDKYICLWQLLYFGKEGM